MSLLRFRSLISGSLKFFLWLWGSCFFSVSPVLGGRPCSSCGVLPSASVKSLVPSAMGSPFGPSQVLVFPLCAPFLVRHDFGTLRSSLSSCFFCVFFSSLLCHRVPFSGGPSCASSELSPLVPFRGGILLGLGLGFLSSPSFVAPSSASPSGLLLLLRVLSSASIFVKWLRLCRTLLLGGHFLP